MPDLQEQNDQLHEQAVRSRLLASVSDALVTSSRDLDAILNRVAGLITLHLGDGCSIQIRSGEDDSHVAIGIAHRDDNALAIIREITADPLPTVSGLTSRVLVTGEPQLFESVPSEILGQTDPRFHPLIDAYPITSVIVVPVRLRGETLGTMNLIRHVGSPPYTTNDQALLLEIANATAFAIDNARLFLEAKAAIAERDESLALLTALLESTTIGMAFPDADLRYRRVNPALAEINGLPVEAHLGRTVAEVLPWVDAELGEVLRGVLRTGEPATGIELSMLGTKQSRARPQWMANFFPVVTNDSVAGIGAAVTDITERKYAEQVSRTLVEASRIFAEVSLDASRTLETVARQLAETLGDACIIWLLSEDGSSRSIAAIHHPDERALAMLRRLAAGAAPILSTRRGRCSVDRRNCSR